MPDPKVVISIEGGLIQDIFHNVPMDITVIDWDHDQVGEDGDPHQYKFADSQGKPAVAYMIDHGGIANMETMPGTDCAFHGPLQRGRNRARLSSTFFGDVS